LQLRYTDEHPEVTKTRRTIADLEKKAEQEALAAPLSVAGGLALPPAAPRAPDPRPGENTRAAVQPGPPAADSDWHARGALPRHRVGGAARVPGFVLQDRRRRPGGDGPAGPGGSAPARV